MNRNNGSLTRLAAMAALFAALAAPQAVFAQDDFGHIVRQIETQYHVHRQHRFVMGLAGFVLKFYHYEGIKDMKGAIFENQQFLNSGDDRLIEVMRGALNSGWQPVVQSWDRRSGEKTFIYAQDQGKDAKVLIVNLESSEAVVLQVKVSKEKLNEFARQASARD